jgi:D-aminopeptidase
MRSIIGPLAIIAMAATSTPLSAQRARARDLGVKPGVFTPGALNAITDVAGVRVGQTTVVEGANVRTGVTAILPHGGNVFTDRVPAALHVGNGFGKITGVTQLRELGELETPILLTCTLCVWKAADAMVEWLLERPDMTKRTLDQSARRGDERRNAERHSLAADQARARTRRADGRHIGTGRLREAWERGREPWPSVGRAGLERRRVCCQSRWAAGLSGVLVQTNFGGILQVLGAPVGKELGQYAFKREAESPGDRGDGSCVIVVATDAPLSDRNLERLAARAIMGLARTGSSASNGSGDYALAFSTSDKVRRASTATRLTTEELANEQMSGLFEGAVEATEEAIYNSLFQATTTTSNGRTIEAIPLDKVRAVLTKYNVVSR